MTYNAPNRITESNSSIVLKELLELIKEESEIIIDFSNTSYISSSALRALLLASKSAKSKSLPPIKYANLSSQVVKTIKSVGFDTIAVIM